MAAEQTMLAPEDETYLNSLVASVRAAVAPC